MLKWMERMYQIALSFCVIVWNGFCFSLLQTCTDKLAQNPNADDLSWNVWFFFLAQLLHGGKKFRLFRFVTQNILLFYMLEFQVLNRSVFIFVIFFFVNGSRSSPIVYFRRHVYR